MRVVVASLLMLACVPAWATWVLVQESADNWLYIDPATIRKAAHYRRVQVLVNFKGQAVLGAYSSRTHQQYNCKERRYRILRRDSFSQWMGGGKAVASLAGPEKWDAVAPGTVAQTIFDRVCAR